MRRRKTERRWRRRQTRLTRWPSGISPAKSVPRSGDSGSTHRRYSGARKRHGAAVCARNTRGVERTRRNEWPARAANGDRSLVSAVEGLLVGRREVKHAERQPTDREESGSEQEGENDSRRSCVSSVTDSEKRKKSVGRLAAKEEKRQRGRREEEREEKGNRGRKPMEKKKTTGRRNPGRSWKRGTKMLSSRREEQREITRV